MCEHPFQNRLLICITSICILPDSTHHQFFVAAASVSLSVCQATFRMYCCLVSKKIKKTRQNPSAIKPSMRMLPPAPSCLGERVHPGTYHGEGRLSDGVTSGSLFRGGLVRVFIRRFTWGFVRVFKPKTIACRGSGGG